MREEREQSPNAAQEISGDNGLRDPPVPIPNTEVKPQHVESTWLETAREDRSSPDSIFLSSSMAERSAVNRNVVGSSPTWGAKNLRLQERRFFYPSRRLGISSAVRRYVIKGDFVPLYLITP